MRDHLLFNLSDLISLVLDAQRHVIRGEDKDADRLLGSAHLLLRGIVKAG